MISQPQSVSLTFLVPGTQLEVTAVQGLPSTGHSHSLVHFLVEVEEQAGTEHVSATEPVRIISKLFSGFVHGGSPQILEMYGGIPPHFHLNGMKDTPLMEVHEQSFFNQFYRGAQNFAIAALALGEIEVFDGAQRQLGLLEKMVGKDFGRKAGGET